MKLPKLLAPLLFVNALTLSFGQINNPAPYCDAVFNNNYNMINSIDVGGTIQNFGPMGSFGVPNTFGYYNTVVLPDLVIGQNTQITIDFYSPNDIEPSYYALYIDFNQNNVFDNNEVVMQNSNTTNALLPNFGAPVATPTLAVNIPTTALVGTTRMRLIRSENPANLFGAYDPAFTLTSCHPLAAFGNSYGCAYDFDVNITNAAAPNLVNNITIQSAGNLTDLEANQTLQLIASVLPLNVTNANIIWSIVNGTGTGTIDSTGLLTGLTPGTIIVTATAADGSGIIGQITITITAQNDTIDLTSNNGNNGTDPENPIDNLNGIDEINIYAPNAFTPGDGTNNTFRIYTENIEKFEMVIYNRFGEIVFQSFDKNGEWDGMYSGRNAQSGTYVYNVQYVDGNNNRQAFIGMVTLLN